MPQSIFGKDFENVYEPAEDTFLLLDAIELDLHEFRRRGKPIVAMECGSGSGAVITSLSKSLNHSMNLMIATDINKQACKTTKKCSLYHKQVHLQVVQTNLAECFVDRLSESVDILVFNPPYVPTEEIETERDFISSGDINLAWAGGDKGRKLTDRFLNSYVPKLLSIPDGVAYLVALDQNNVTELQDFLVKTHSIRGSSVLKRRAGQELLHVIKYQRIEQ